MKRLVSTSLTPADGFVLPGCIALAGYLHAQRIDAQSALLLFRLVQDDDHDLDEEEVMKFLGVDLVHAWTAMADLEQKRGWADYHGDRDAMHRITLTQAGQLEALAIFGAVMLAGTPADAVDQR
jgi:hypothetical protein